MERQVITIQEECVIYAPHLGEVWMTAWEIAELFYVSGVTVKNTIKRIWKQGALRNLKPTDISSWIMAIRLMCITWKWLWRLLFK